MSDADNQARLGTWPAPTILPMSATPRPSHAIDSSAPQPLILPRNLIFLAFMWLVLSWLQSIGFPPPLNPATETYQPGVRELMIFITIGLSIAWPLYRLSGPRSDWPVSVVVLDLMVLLAMVQVVLWPLSLVTNWSRLRVGAIDAAMGTSTILIGAVIAVAISTSSRGVRSLSMAVVLLFAFAGPVVEQIAAQHAEQPAAELSLLSPIFAVARLAAGNATEVLRTQWVMLFVAAGAAIVAWIIAVPATRKLLAGTSR